MFALALFAQEVVPNSFVIRNVEYHITGRTRVSALSRFLSIREGMSFNVLEALETYITDENRELCNLRTLEPAESGIIYTLGEAEATEQGRFIPVYIEITITDSRNFLILPEPKYDSNSGFSVSLKARDYNFLGNMNPFKFDLIWGNDEYGEQMTGFAIDSDIPFSAFGYEWNFNFDHDFRCYFDAPLYYKNIMGISVQIPVGFTTLIPGIEQGLVIHEKDADAKHDGGYHSWYMYNKPSLAWKIPTPLIMGDLGEITYIPEVHGNINYQPGGDIGDYRRGPNAGFNQRLGFGQIDWIGNFRRGLKIEIVNNNDYNFFHQNRKNSVGITAEGHYPFNDWFGVSSRLLYTRWLGDTCDWAGDTIRGYKDNTLETERRFSLNLDFPFRLIRFIPSEWSGKKSWRVIDFEQHWSPFIDLMLADAPKQGYSFKPAEIITAAGLEIITYPLKWRSIYIRVSGGCVINEWIKTGSFPGGIYRELYIGLGHFY